MFSSNLELIKQLKNKQRVVQINNSFVGFFKILFKKSFEWDAFWQKYILNGDV